jgi:predicted nucleic-acid-binding protein
MIALDTNILVRYLVQDDPDQAVAATHLIEQDLSEQAPGFVSVTALLELDWVLRSQYGFSAANVSAVVAELMNAASLVFEFPDEIEVALTERHGDLADRVLHHTARANGCDRTLTFDKNFARLDGVELLGG